MQKLASDVCTNRINKPNSHIVNSNTHTQKYQQECLLICASEACHV